jgi:hypothetical protein
VSYVAFSSHNLQTCHKINQHGLTQRCIITLSDGSLHQIRQALQVTYIYGCKIVNVQFMFLTPHKHELAMPTCKYTCLGPST